MLSRPLAAPWYLPFLHPPSSLSTMFCCCVTVLALSSFDHTGVAGEKENKKTRFCPNYNLLASSFYFLALGVSAQENLPSGENFFAVFHICRGAMSQ